MTDFSTINVLIMDYREPPTPEVREITYGRHMRLVAENLAAIVRTHATHDDKCAVGLLVKLHCGDLVHVEITATLWDMINAAAKGAQLRIEDETR